MNVTQPHRPNSWVTTSEKRRIARELAAQLQREVDEIVNTPLCVQLNREERQAIREKLKRKLPVRNLR